jgi:exosortase/archaeosortase family protein
MNSAIRFFALLVGIYLFFYFLHQWVILPYGKIDNFLNYILSMASFQALQVLGIESSLKIVPYTPIANHYIYWGNQSMVLVGAACNGFLLYILFACFIFLSKGKWWQKVLFVSAGITAIFALNVIRVILLLYTLTISPTLFEINHHYVFSFVVYAFIFLMWRYWLNKQNPDEVS